MIIEKKLTPKKQLSDGNFNSKFELGNPEIIEIEEDEVEVEFESDMEETDTLHSKRNKDIIKDEDEDNE